MAWYSKVLNFNSNTMHLRNLLINRNRNSLNQCRTASIKPAVYESLNIPPPPKKPLTPYMNFVLSTRAQVVKDLPSPALAQNIFKEIGQRWAKCDEQEKKKLRDEYTKAFQEYKKRMAEYEASLTPEQKTALQQYIYSNTDQNDTKKWNKDVIKAISKDYSELPEEKRMEYKKKSRELLERYAKDKRLWESEMVRQGNFSAVQSKAIRTIAPRKPQEKEA